MRKHLTYANIMATVAVFIALGGSSYAAFTITGRDVRNGSLTGKDLKRNSVGGARVSERSFGPVPLARNAQRVGGATESSLRVRCLGGLRQVASTCFETQPRAERPYSAAVADCKVDGRRLPTHGELVAALADGLALAGGGELTSSVFEDNDDQLKIVTVTGAGSTGRVPETQAGARGFHCVTGPAN